MSALTCTYMCFKSILSKINELEKKGCHPSIHLLHFALYVCLILKELLPERKTEDNPDDNLFFYF